MTAQLLTDAARVNIPEVSTTNAGTTHDMSRGRRPKRRPFSHDGKQWTPYAVDLLRLRHGPRSLAGTLKQVAVESWRVKGAVRGSWGRIAALCGKASSTVRTHFGQLRELGLLELVEQGGGRIMVGTRLRGRASVWRVTDLGWAVCRSGAPWPAPAPALQEGPPAAPGDAIGAEDVTQPTPPAPVILEHPGAPPPPPPPNVDPPGAPAPEAPWQSGRQTDPPPWLSYLPKVGTQVECEGLQLGGLRHSPPTPPPAASRPPVAESSGRQGPPAGELVERRPADVVPPPDGGSYAPAGAPTPPGAGGMTAGARQCPQDGRRRGGPLGVRWTPSSLERALQREGAPPESIPDAIRRAMREGVGAPLAVARWYVREEWPRRERARLEAQLRREELARADEETRRKVREAAARADVPSERGGCPHVAGALSCPACVAWGLAQWRRDHPALVAKADAIDRRERDRLWIVRR